MNQQAKMDQIESGLPPHPEIGTNENPSKGERHTKSLTPSSMLNTARWVPQCQTKSQDQQAELTTNLQGVGGKATKRPTTIGNTDTANTSLNPVLSVKVRTCPNLHRPGNALPLPNPNPDQYVANHFPSPPPPLPLVGCQTKPSHLPPPPFTWIPWCTWRLC